MDMKLLEALPYIDPDDYGDWTTVGMALKHEGFGVDVWDSWSRNSQKYTPGMCERKWRSFNEGNSGAPVTGGTIVQMAKDRGWSGSGGAAVAFGWDDEVEEIGRDYKIVDTGFVKEESVPEPDKKYDGAADLREYLATLFRSDDYVGYCDELTNDNGRWVPKHGKMRRTAGQLIEDLRNGFEQSSIKSRSPGGGMIRFNPLDGNGESDSNVTRYTYCLIESDKDSIEKQYSLYKAMNLPIAVLVHSGNKSLHAIVHVDAESLHQYRERVNFIYEFCKKNGLKVDEQDKNASRYSRMPGVMRDGKWQYIVGTNIGPGNYTDWRQWVDEQNDNLPKDVSLAEIWENLPPLKPELIEGILRIGHKLLLSGPSKAGKSFVLMYLGISIAEGLDWLGHHCSQGKVLYINLELDEASCYHRFVEIYHALGVEPKNLQNITIWNLRGRAVPMDKLTPFLIHRFKDKGYAAVIIDPIYKVITGDENSATEMSMFCSYFDRAAIDINAAMIYCHHHSKGAGMKYSKAADRASGSGVFARDPDAILDLLELEATPDMVERYRKQVPGENSVTAWELSGTLREFPPIAPVRLWFDYPAHRVDQWNFLADAKEGETAARKSGVGKKQKSAVDWDKDLAAAYEANGGDADHPVCLDAITGYMQVDGKPARQTIINNLKKRKYSFSRIGGKDMVLKS